MAQKNTAGKSQGRRPGAQNVNISTQVIQQQPRQDHISQRNLFFTFH